MLAQTLVIFFTGLPTASPDKDRSTSSQSLLYLKCHLIYYTQLRDKGVILRIVTDSARLTCKLITYIAHDQKSSNCTDNHALPTTAFYCLWIVNGIMRKG